MAELSDDIVDEFNEWLDSVDLNSASSSGQSVKKQRLKVSGNAGLSAFQKHQQKQKNELSYLKQKVAELQEHARILKESNEVKALIDPPSKWEQLAKRERKRRLQAMRENERLKASLDDQVKFAESLAAIVRKRPRLSLFSNECEKPWKQATLTKDPIERKATCQAVTDEEYQYLESAFIEARLIDSTNEHRRYHACVQHGVLEVHTMLHFNIRNSMDIVARVAWDILRGAYPVRSVGGIYELMEELDEDTAYVNSVCHYSVGTMLRRVAMRRYWENPTRCVVVARNITKDDLYPIDTSLDITEEVSWLVMEEEDVYDADAGQRTKNIVARYFQKSKPAFAEFRPKEIQEPESKYLMELYGNYCDGFISTMEQVVENESSGQSSSDDSIFARNGLSLLPAKTKSQLAMLKHKKKMQDEVAFLNRTVVELNAQLAQLTQDKRSDKTPTRWERLAKCERKRQNDSLRENRRLKLALEEQVKFAENLVQLMRKKPKLDLIPGDAHDHWNQLNLGLDPVARLNAYHGIIDHTYNDIDAAFIEAGLVDCPLNRHDYVPKSTNNMLEIQSIVCMAFPAPVDITSEASWQVLRGAVDMPCLNGSYKMLVEIDPSTTYVAGVRHHAFVVTQRRVIVKKYIEDDRFVIVTRSIYEDEMYPMDDNVAHCNEISWLTVESLSPTSSIVKFFQKSTPTSNPSNEFGHECEYLMDSFPKNTAGYEAAILNEIYRLEGLLQQSHNSSNMTSESYRDVLLRGMEKIDTDYIGGINVATGSNVPQSKLGMTNVDQAILDTICTTPSTNSDKSDREDGKPEPKKQLNKQQLAVLRHRKRRQNEFAYLKKAVIDLQAQLASLNQAAELREILNPPSRWEKFAKVEKKREQEAITENRLLRAAIQEQVQFAECLMTIVRKKPRLAALSTDQNDLWKQMTLAADPHIRSFAMHAIVDREYERVNSALIECGLLDDNAQEVRKHIPKIVHGMLEIETLVCKYFREPMHVVAEGVWQVFRGAVEMHGDNGTYRCIANIDPSFAYVSDVRPFAMGVIERRIIVKKYVDSPSRVVFVGRGIHEDQLYPINTGHSVTNEVSWTTIESCPSNPGMTVVKHFLKLKPTLTHYQGMDETIPISRYIMDAYSLFSMSFGRLILQTIARLSAHYAHG
ncbi:hypothetical protein THRCLA_20353 [Thraustotheca clavata]|uniref:START domain-containing protein n=1 Tax=Thraustotheca clavata TaxID=74557 RepID=A0A1W0A8D0_9STRA|nr:hypothetical protein THRCLA_20353 [Thraustotheca clavata]